MVDVKPFRAIRYDGEKVGGIDKVITQPYDKISSEQQEEYYAKSEYNYCRLILPREDERYEVASGRLKAWLQVDVLIKDSEPGMYIYYQDFQVLGKRYTRKGFVAAVKLHPFEDSVVLPHEKTHKGPKIDRLNMLRATEKNLEPGFMLYSDPRGESIDIFDKVAEGEPLYEATDEYGVHNRIWKLDAPDHIATVENILRGQQVVIADGHHRYETAVSYRDEMREKVKNWTPEDAFNWRMTFMVPVEDPGLVVLPGHRLLLKNKVEEGHVQELEKFFAVREIPIEESEDFLEGNRGRVSFVMYTGDKTLGLTLEQTDLVKEFLSDSYSPDYTGLDVVILRDVIFEHIMGAKDLAIDETIAYERWAKDAIDRVEKGRATAAFLVNATKPEQVLRVAKNGERMPEKSTDFYPKANSGFVMMDISPGEKL